MSEQEAFRNLPSVSAVLSDERVEGFVGEIQEPFIADVARRYQDMARTAIRAGDTTAANRVIDLVVDELSLLAGRRSTPVVNGTGVVIHTNLGRSPVSHETAEAMRGAASRYLPLEIDLESGKRGGRGGEVEAMMRSLTGAERTLVVNNNAAAVTLVLAATSAGRKAIVSRGEAIEIGGGFRIPDVLSRSGAILTEVGTTNRTYLSDYEAEIDENTAALLKIHASNFAVVGFTAQPSISDMANLAHSRGILAMEDVGSGCLLDTTRYGLVHEPALGDSIGAGADVVMASGDKLLGGPQAGLIIGKAEVVNTISRHPLARAMRADKTAMAGIAATLRHYLRGEAEEAVPIWWSISRTPEWLRSRADSWSRQIDDPSVSVVGTQSAVGGGSLPGMTLPSFALAITSTGCGPDDLAHRLRTGEIAVIPRVVDNQVIIDTRTVLADEDERVVEAVRIALTRT